MQHADVCWDDFDISPTTADMTDADYRNARVYCFSWPWSKCFINSDSVNFIDGFQARTFTISWQLGFSMWCTLIVDKPIKLNLMTAAKTVARLRINRRSQTRHAILACIYLCNENTPITL